MTKDKAIKVLGAETVQSLEEKSVEALKEGIVVSEASMKQMKEELEANEEYKGLKERLKDVSSGTREVNKRQKSIIQFSLSLLAEKGNN
jgi:hypothetical protein